MMIKGDQGFSPEHWGPEVISTAKAAFSDYKNIFRSFFPDINVSTISLERQGFKICIFLRKISSNLVCSAFRLKSSR